MTKTDFKALYTRFKYNKQTKEDEKLVSPYAPHDGSTSWMPAVEQYIKAMKTVKEEQLDLFTNQGLMFHLADDDSAIPKQMLRGSLFAPIKRGRRKYHNNMLVAEFADGNIKYTGAQLDQADLDVLLIIVKLLSSYTTTGNVVKISEITDENGRVEYSRMFCGSKGLLKMLGRSKGSSNRQWLWSALHRLTGELTITIEQKTFAGSILGKRAKAKNGLLMIDINQDFVRLFTGNNFTFIDITKRFELKGDFTKWLQCFVSTHTGQSTYSAEKLIKISGCNPKSVRHWILRQAKPAFEQLKRQGAIKNYSANGHLFSWFK